MQLLKRYAASLLGAFGLLIALVYVKEATRHFFGDGDYPLAWHHETLAYEVADLAASAAHPALLLTVVVGLAVAVRSPESPVPLAAAVLMLAVATTGFLAALVSWYRFVSTNTVFGIYGDPVREAVLLLGGGLVSSAAVLLLGRLIRQRAG